MRKKNISFSRSATDFLFSGSLAELEKWCNPLQTVLITDENVFEAHTKKFTGWNTIVLKPGEQFKVQATVDSIIDQLLAMEADRSFTLVGIGGGVVTDLTGYVAGIYMRGIRFGFVPTSILAMVDAAIGGKNGIDVGPFKNMVGLIRQPDFLLYDMDLLRSLPKEEWINGMAEVIKHGAIKDAKMFSLLEETSLTQLRKNTALCGQIIQRNALLKAKVVQEDEFEKGSRRLLNFGHTLGHAIENTYQLKHGHAISLGMIAAASISQDVLQFQEANRLKKLLKKYQLPTEFDYSASDILPVLKMDKKRVNDTMNFILLKKIGKAIVQPIAWEKLEAMIGN